MKQLLFIVGMMLCLGCMEAAGTNGGGGTNPKKPAGKIEQLQYEACRKRDACGGELLERLADEIKAKREAGETLHDKWVMDRISEANTEASKSAGSELNAELGSVLNGGDKLDSKKAEQAVREMAAGRKRRGAK